MTTTTINRPTIPGVCPPWCAGHLDQYQGWETLTDGTGESREHSSHSTTFGSVEISTGQTEHSERGMGVPVVEVFVNRDMAELTEAQAHELGMALVRAADVVRRALNEATR